MLCRLHKYKLGTWERYITTTQGCLLITLYCLVISSTASSSPPHRAVYWSHCIVWLYHLQHLHHHHTGLFTDHIVLSGHIIYSIFITTTQGCLLITLYCLVISSTQHLHHHHTGLFTDHIVLSGYIIYTASSSPPHRAVYWSHCIVWSYHLQHLHHHHTGLFTDHIVLSGHIIYTASSYLLNLDVSQKSVIWRNFAQSCRLDMDSTYGRVRI